MKTGRLFLITVSVVTLVWVAAVVGWCWGAVAPAGVTLARFAQGNLTLEVIGGDVSVGLLRQAKPAQMGQSSLSVDKRSFAGVLMLRTERVMDTSASTPTLNATWKIVRLDVRRLSVWGIVPVIALWWMWLVQRTHRRRVGFPIAQGHQSTITGRA